MIKNKETNLLVEELKERNVKLYHACQLKDFISYLKLGGVPSRHRLETKGKSYTAFLSDSNDKENEVWDKVFFNMQDFGNFFHRHRSLSTPNVYGPIVLVFEPDILENATDISITLRSAGAKGFSRTNEALSLDQVREIFSYPPSDKHRKTWIKKTSVLKETFKEQSNLIITSSPEINCTYNRNIFALGQESFDNLKSILVDPLSHNSQKLIDKVKEAASNYNPILEGYVKQRFSSYFMMYNLLTKFAYRYTGLTEELDTTKSPFPSPLDGWIQSFSKESHFYQVHRYLTYLKNGTLEPMDLTKEEFLELLAA